jgi:predicted sulfurtransferase
MSDSTEQSTQSVFRLMYRSRNRIPAGDRKAELGRLFTTARSNNKAKNITGALLLADDWFVQTLEGDESAVRALFDHIAADPRHDEVSLLESETKPVGERVFSRWAMARVAADEADSDINLISHQDGIAEAASRGTTSDQETVLDVMRAAARGVSQAR